MMANVNMALEEIITSNKHKNRSGGAGGGRRNLGASRRAGATIGGGFRSGGNRRENYFSDDTPAGKWKHDKFVDIYGGGKKRSVGGGASAAVGIRRPRAGNASSEIVKLNISNLPETVLTADLEELFQDFGVYGVTVHYDEAGQHLGTADLFVDFLSAKDIIREYANIAIDGQEINIAVVDESGVIKPRMQDRIRRVANNPIRGRRAQLQRRSPVKRVGGGRIRGSAKGGVKPRVKQMTADELDKELEAYMSSRTT